MVVGSLTRGRARAAQSRHVLLTTKDWRREWGRGAVMEASIVVGHPPRTPLLLSLKPAGATVTELTPGIGAEPRESPAPPGHPLQRAQAEARRQVVPDRTVSLTKTAQSSLPLGRPSPLPQHPPRTGEPARRPLNQPAAQAQPPFCSSEPQPASGTPCRRGHGRVAA